jgi:signal transduction histidine kinase
LNNDTIVNIEILEDLENAKNILLSLNFFSVGNTQNGNNKITRNFGGFLSEIELHVNQLHKLISFGFHEEFGSIDSLITQEYSHFQKTFLEFENNINEFIAQQNSNFRLKIFTLLMAIFGFLILCLVLVIRLMNAYFIADRHYVEKSIEIENKERKRIAVELHDGLGSLLSSIGLYTKLLEKDFSNEKINHKLIQVKQLSDMALESLENAINNLNPSILNKNDLIKSLELVCNKMNDIGNIYFHLESDNMNVSISKNAALNFFRICNELINNTLKHSGANEAKIELYNKRKKVFLRYSDNGIGFDPLHDYSFESEKTGLHNMIKRVESLGGTYSINSERGKGVYIIIQYNVG